MADDEFVPEKRTIESLLVGAEYYVIPRFQRPYSWDRENVDDFWRDVIVDNQSGYFIGPMVAWRDKKASVRRLVDGQQRMTTIIIVLAVLRGEFDRLQQTSLADGIHRYLEKPDRDNQPQFTLRSESDWKFLNHSVLARKPSAAVKPKSDEDKVLDTAHRDLKKRVAEAVNERKDPIVWLKEVRDRVLNLTVIWVEHGNEDDAYIVFETLNSRGKDLEVVDLMKNHLLSKLKGAGNPQSDHARKQWQDMREALAGTDDRSTLDANTYIHRWWLTRNEYVAQKKLFRLAKSSIKTEFQASMSLNSLESETVAYRAALDPRSRQWHTSENIGAKSLRTLADFGIVQPAPALFSLVRKRLQVGEDQLAAKQFNKALRTILRYHFQYTIIAQLSSSGGISEMYAKFGREFHHAKTASENASIISDFCEKLIQRAPDRDLFIEAFVDRFLLTTKFNRESKLVKYVLGELLASTNINLDTSTMTIEHIEPQSHIASDEDAFWIGSIGNLLLVDGDTNAQKLGDKPFEDKIQVLHTLPYDVGVAGIDVDAWNRAATERRSKLLGEIAYDKVWKLGKSLGSAPSAST